LQVTTFIAQVLFLGLLEVRHIAHRDKYQQTNGQHTQGFP